jgi:3-phenylpropionate/trans-cinnamate dioxygenase ferredoxin subunit
MPGRYVVARVDAVPEGGRVIVDLGGRSVGIFRVDGKFYGIMNRCPHAGAELCRGTIVGQLDSDKPGHYRFDPGTRYLVCPWHGWEFELKTGRSYFEPGRTRARAYPVSVEGGEQVTSELDSGEAQLPSGPGETIAGARVKGPYQVETLDVSVEGDYLIVSTLRHTSER